MRTGISNKATKTRSSRRFTEVYQPAGSIGRATGMCAYHGALSGGAQPRKSDEYSVVWLSIMIALPG